MVVADYLLTLQLLEQYVNGEVVGHPHLMEVNLERWPHRMPAPSPISRAGRDPARIIHESAQSVPQPLGVRASLTQLGLGLISAPDIFIQRVGTLAMWCNNSAANYHPVGPPSICPLTEPVAIVHPFSV